MIAGHKVSCTQEEKPDTDTPVCRRDLGPEPHMKTPM